MHSAPEPRPRTAFLSAMLLGLGIVPGARGQNLTASDPTGPAANFDVTTLGSPGVLEWAVQLTGNPATFTIYDTQGSPLPKPVIELTSSFDNGDSLVVAENRNIHLA